MSVKRVASRYAKSVLDLAIESNRLEKVKDDMQSLQTLIGNSKDLAAFLKSPVIQFARKQAILQGLFAGKIDELTLKFILLLAGKQRESLLPEIVIQFMDQYRALKHISVVHVVSASELSAEQIQMLKSKIESSPVGFENVEIHTRIDPSLIGGFVVELDDKVLDASVRHHLEGLRKGFKTNLYESKIMAR